MRDNSAYPPDYRVCATSVYDTDPVFLAPNNDTLRSLFSFGFNVNEHDQDGYTLLHRACQASDLERVLFLVDHGAIVSRINYKTNESVADYATDPFIVLALSV